jgi:DNA-binding transcriptional LysR family regulator
MIPTNLDMDVLRTLVIAIDLGGFGKAANRLGRTQSAISLQMKKLEEQAGEPLFRRNGRGVALTDPGDVLLGYARRIILMNDEALAAVRGGTIGGTVRLGLPQDLAERWLPGVLKQFHGAHPLTHVEAQFGRSRDLRDDVAQGALDLALSFGDIDQPEGGHQPLGRMPLVWIGRPGFAADPSGPLPLALLDAPCLFRQYGIGLLDEARKPWRVAFTSPSLSGLWAAVEAGLGVTLRTGLGVPEGLTVLDARSGLPGLATVPLLLHVSANT